MCIVQVNTASRIESTSFPMCVQLSEATRRCARSSGMAADRVAGYGDRELKGKGFMRTHLLKVGDWERAMKMRTHKPKPPISLAALAAGD